ncbi:MAG TPA: diacylglycerol kinase family protein [Acidimicrobiales bacterium]
MSDGFSERVSARRRTAALVSVGCFVLLVLILVVILVRHADSLTIGIVGLGVAAAGGWWVLTEQMPRRAFGAIGLAVGFGAIVLAIARAINGADRVALWGVLVVAVLLAMLASAHRAMMRDLDRLQPHVRVGGPPRRAVLLCNPWSGGGKVERFGLVDLAAELAVETVLLDRGLDLEQLARDAVARGADCLGMAGGDGSQALVASIAIEHGLPFVCVSAGTRNHFALDLGLNREDPRASMLAFRDAVERTVDYATVNGRLFVNNVSLGVYAQIVQEEAYRDAKVETTKVLLPEMLGRQAAPFDLQFTTPSGDEIDGAILIMVSNNPYVIGASPDNAQRRHLDSGELGVFAVTTSTGAAAAVLFAATALGQRRRSPFWTEFTTTSFEVRSHSGDAFAGVDGEALDMPTPLRFEIHPRGLKLLVPAGNVEMAERRRAHDVAIADLVTLARGYEPRQGPSRSSSETAP